LLSGKNISAGRTSQETRNTRLVVTLVIDQKAIPANNWRKKKHKE